MSFVQLVSYTIKRRDLMICLLPKERKAAAAEFFVTWLSIDNEGGNMLETIYWFKIQY